MGDGPFGRVPPGGRSRPEGALGRRGLDLQPGRLAGAGPGGGKCGPYPAPAALLHGPLELGPGLGPQRYHPAVAVDLSRAAHAAADLPGLAAVDRAEGGRVGGRVAGAERLSHMVQPGRQDVRGGLAPGDGLLRLVLEPVVGRRSATALGPGLRTVHHVAAPGQLHWPERCGRPVRVRCWGLPGRSRASAGRQHVVSARARVDPAELLVPVRLERRPEPD